MLPLRIVSFAADHASLRSKWLPCVWGVKHSLNAVVVTKNRCLVTKNRPPERSHHAHLKKRAGEARSRNFNSPWSSVPGNPASIAPGRSASSIAEKGVKHSPNVCCPRGLSVFWKTLLFFLLNYFEGGYKGWLLHPPP